MLERSALIARRMECENHDVESDDHNSLLVSSVKVLYRAWRPRIDTARTVADGCGPPDRKTLFAGK